MLSSRRLKELREATEAEQNKGAKTPTGVSASSQVKPEEDKTPGSALVARLCAPDNESSGSDSKDSNDMSHFERGSFCARCVEHNIHTPARINGYTGVTLCLSCTMKFYDPNMTDAHYKPGRALSPDADDEDMVVQQALSNDESSFDEDYVPKLVPDSITLAQKLGVEPTESMCGQKVDLKDLTVT